jgi:hypothetical protein
MPSFAPPAPSSTAIALALDAVILAVTDERPRILVVTNETRQLSIPSGPLDPDQDATLELGLRRWVRHQTGLEVGYVEQLYTFGDRGRRRDSDARLLSVGYLALMREEQPAPGAAWLDCYRLFPWEDQRSPGSNDFEHALLNPLQDWAGRDEGRRARVHVCFGAPPTPWDPIRVLERYELLYEAGLVAEAYQDRGRPIPATLATGQPLQYDHRRIAAAALGRVRGKLTYRPVVFELLPDLFTLTQLQSTVETLSGLRIHKQNFRRLIENSRLVQVTDQLSTATGGRPAKLFRFRREVLGERPRPGVLRPRL